MNKKLIALLLALAMLFSLAACGGKDVGAADPGKKSGDPAAPAAPTPVQVYLAPDATCATASGVTVDVGNFVLNGEAELTVEPLPEESDAEAGWKIEPYDISIGDLHELDDFITIRIPYTTDFCDAGEDPARCVGAKYKNEATGEWEDVLFEVDAEANEIVIYTDHLSYYGVFYVENEGKRNAYITDVLDSGLYMDDSAAVGFAERIAADDPTVMQDLAKFGIEASSKFFDYSDRLDNAISMATLGDIPDWLNTEISGTSLTLFSAIGYVATCTSLMKVAINDTVGGGADKGEVLNLIRDVGSKVTAYWADAFTTAGSAAMSVGMGGVLIIDKMLTAFAEEAYSTKLEDISYVYHFYNERYTGGDHKPMTSKDWRAKVIEVIDKHPDDPEVAIDALEAAFRKYSAEFFTLGYDEQCGIAGEVPEVTVKNLPHISSEDEAKLTEDYIAHLKDKVMPGVLKSVDSYMIKKAEQQQIQAINAVKDFYNTKITITISEKDPAEGKSQYLGYKFRFAPLNDTAVVGNWTGKWDGNPIKTSATLMGFLTAGLPHTVEFFAPDADMNTAEPEFVVPFVIGMPEISIEFSGGPKLEDLVGEYSGEVNIASFCISDEAYEMYAADAEGDGDLLTQAQCDEALGEMVAEGELTVAQSFSLLSEHPETGNCVLVFQLVSDDTTPLSVPATYNNGILTVDCADGTTAQVTVSESGGILTLTGENVVTGASDAESGDIVLFYVGLNFTAAK